MSTLMFPDQGSVQRHVLPQAQPQTHTVVAGENVAQLADRYGVQPQAIRDANPHIFRDADPHRRHDAQANGGNPLFGGDVLTIPAASMSVTEAPIDSGNVNPTFPSPNSEHRAGPVTFNPDDGSVKLTAEQSRELGSRGGGDPHGIGGGKTGRISLGVSTKQEVSAGQTNKDGNTEFTIEVVGEASINGHVEAGGPRGVFIDGSAGTGASFRYKVVLKGENQPLEKALAIDPTDPTTIPDGGTILLDGRQFAKTVYAESFNHVAAHSERLDGTGVTYAISRQGSSVSVLAGPTQTIESFSGAGVRVGDVTAIAGRQDLLGSSQLQAATFDLSNPDGQAAYQHFMTTGQVAHETPGVSGVASIGRVDMTSQPRLKVEAGAVGAIDLAGGQTTTSFVRTDFPDGSFTQTLSFKEETQAGGVPLQITSRFDAQGNEILSERTYAYTIDTSSPGTAEYLNMALSGGSGGSIQSGNKVVLTFSEGQMRELLEHTRNARGAYEIPSAGDHLGILLPGGEVPAGSETAVFATRMGTLMDSYPYKFASRLVDVSRGADGNNEGGRLVPVNASVSFPA